MALPIEAIYEEDVLPLMEPLDLPEGERVSITLTTVAEVKARLAARAARDAHEIEIINQNIDTLNAKALDVLDYQLAKEQI